MSTHRADFARNERRILDAAARLLAERPGAGMADVAQAAGVGRATLYRHFPTREALEAGMRAEAFDAVGAVIDRRCAAAAAGSVRPGAALRALAEELVAVGDQHRIVFAGPPDPRLRATARERFDPPLVDLLQRAQTSGELDPEVPAGWLLIAMEGAISAALRAVGEGRLTLAQAKRLVVRTVVEGFAPR